MVKDVLVLKDSLSHFCELFPCSSPSSSAAVTALLDWTKRCGRPGVHVSDQETHFRNTMVDEFCARLKTDRRFSPAYSSWLNGTAERLNKDGLQVMRALLLDNNLDFREWVYLLPVFQANLNCTLVVSRTDKSPIEVFLALPASSALDIVQLPGNGASTLVEVDPPMSAAMSTRCAGRSNRCTRRLST